MKLRNIGKMNGPNNGTRTLIESLMAPEVIRALNDWKKSNVDSVLIGGAALSFFVKPRFTQDLDFLFLNESDIPVSVNGFKRIRNHAFQHVATHVEVELVTAALVNIPIEVVKQIINTAVESNGVKIASASGLAVSKLFRLSLQDKADIVALIKTGKVNVSGFNLPQDKVKKYMSLVADAANDDHGNHS